MKIWRYLLWPFSLLYTAGLHLNNFLYKKRILRSQSFNLPIIVVGNLSLGGTGKSPMTEYLINLLKADHAIATLSRGYRRSTKGYLAVTAEHSAREVGDEPKQFKTKFPDVLITVGEDRVMAIPELIMDQLETEVVILDDAYQHQALDPYKRILLTEYARPYFKDRILPMGNLRDLPSAASKADVVIVSKCPNDITSIEKKEFRQALNLELHQSLFFSSLEYGEAYSIFNPAQKIDRQKMKKIFLVSGIANPKPLIDQLSTFAEVKHKAYRDHYYFRPNDLKEIHDEFQQWSGGEGVILTTEKDAMRMLDHRSFILEMPIFALPIKTIFDSEDQATFDALVKDWLLNFEEDE